MDTIYQFFENMDQYPEMKIMLTIGIVLIVLIVAWLLLRNLRLWYWKTDKVLDSIRDMKVRMNQIESDLDLIKGNTELLKKPETLLLEQPEEEKLPEEEKDSSEAVTSNEPVLDESEEKEVFGEEKAEIEEEVQLIKESVQRKPKIYETLSKEERAAQKRALDARQTMEISREELSQLVAAWEEQLQQQEGVAEPAKGAAPKVAKKVQRPARKQEQKSDEAVKQPMIKEGVKEEPHVKEELEGVKKALEELQRQKEQLEADLKARIRI